MPPQEIGEPTPIIQPAPPLPVNVPVTSTNKISKKLKFWMNRSPMVGAIIRTNIGGMDTVYPKLWKLAQLPIFQRIQHKRLGVEFFSLRANGEVLEALTDFPEVQYISPLYQVNQLPWFGAFTKEATNQFSIVWGQLQTIMARGYQPKEGQIPSSVIHEAGGVYAQRNLGFDGEIPVGVSDTGTTTSRQISARSIPTKSSRWYLPAYVDESGHMQWIESYTFGSRVDLGNGVIIDGGLTKAKPFGARCLFTPAGAGSNMDVLEGARILFEDYDVKIGNFSLGSEDYEDCVNDPTAIAMNGYAAQGKIPIVAAGNSGPAARTIGHPGCVENVITVGSWSYMDNAPSFFSSRGPTRMGREKPDITYYGGGRELEDSKPKEGILSSSSNLIDVSDGIPNRLAAIAGTSMSCPGVVIITAQWCDEYKKKTGRELNALIVKDVYKDIGESWKADRGHGLLHASWMGRYLA